MTEWITELIRKMNAQHSKVAFVETNDPERLPQFVNYALLDKASFDEVYRFDPVHSLVKMGINEEGELTIETIDLGGEQDLLGNTPQIDINAVFEWLHEIANERTLVIINDDPRQVEKLLPFYCHDDDLYNKDQFVTFFSPHCEKLGDEVRELAINISPPRSTPQEREEIIREILEGFKKLDTLEDIHIMATAGLNLVETRSAILDSMHQKNMIDLSVITQYKIQAIERSGVLKVLKTYDGGFSLIGGYDPIKRFATDNIIYPLQNPEIATKLRMRLPRGLLTFGAGGDGKTYFAKCFAGELGLLAVELLTSNIFSKYQGESGRNLAKALDLIDELSPCLVFIDEFGAMGVRVGTETDGGTRRDVFDRFLSWMGSKERTAIVLATTNTPEQLDPAMIRVGRFDYNVYFPRPDLDARSEVLQVHIGDMKVYSNGKTLNTKAMCDGLANQTDLYSCAELEELVIRAKRNAMRDRSDNLADTHFFEALESFTINEKAVRKQQEDYLKLADELINDKQFLADLKQSMVKTVASTKKVTKKVVKSMTAKEEN